METNTDQQETTNNVAEQIPPSTSPSKPHVSRKIIVVVVLLLMVGMVATYYLWQQTHQAVEIPLGSLGENTSSPTPVPTNDVLEEIQAGSRPGWKKYINYDQGYSFEYPSTEEGMSKQAAQDRRMYFGFSAPIENGASEAFLNEPFAYADTRYQIDNPEKINSDQWQGILQPTTSKTESYAKIVYNNTGYVLFYTPNKSDPSGLFKEILSTFMILDNKKSASSFSETFVDISKTIQFNYPKDWYYENNDNKQFGGPITRFYPNGVESSTSPTENNGNEVLIISEISDITKANLEQNYQTTTIAGKKAYTYTNKVILIMDDNRGVVLEAMNGGVMQFTQIIETINTL